MLYTLSFGDAKILDKRKLKLRAAFQAHSMPCRVRLAVSLYGMIPRIVSLSSRYTWSVFCAASAVSVTSVGVARTDKCSAGWTSGTG